MYSIRRCRLILDWTILDQVAVAALETGNDVLAEVHLYGMVLIEGLYWTNICQISYIASMLCAIGNAIGSSRKTL
jgi:hypothetical protein